MEFSAFLPQNFSKQAKIAIIAGRGSYPALLCDRIAGHGLDTYLIALDGETGEDLISQFSDDKFTKISIGQIGKLLSFVKNNGIGYVMMAGQVQPKKLFHGLIPDFKAISMLAKLPEKNAETIFGAVATELESVGAKVLDARCFMDSDLATAGNMTKTKLRIREEHLAHGIKIAKGISELNIGQCAILRKGTVLAVEDFAGTNDLIRRASKFKVDDAFLIKTCKCERDYRFDVPVFGQQTLNLMVEHSILTAVLEANSVIMLEKESIIASANGNNVAIYGF
ncbi:MAG: UDP-2,3-diacylglucosamine diphosphatase LpxI [Puniceicoccales bacterium]|jgi:DUF1009 family protein|nr:UDP-2,3-diacylglucosamine diphosphatase LpxI [Puniceicoccales bacterium]